MTRQLTKAQAAGMTVNERLFLAGLLDEFDNAVENKDRARMAVILENVYLSTDPEYIEQLLAAPRLASEGSAPSDGRAS